MPIIPTHGPTIEYDVNSNTAVPTTTPITIPAPIVYTAADSHGATDIVNLVLGTTDNAAPITVSQLTLSDRSGNGIGALNVLAYDTTPFDGAATRNTPPRLAYHTISILDDPGLSSLTVSGSGDLAIIASTGHTASDVAANLVGFYDTAKTLTLTDNSTSTYGLSFNKALIAPNLTTLNLAGSDSVAGSIYIGSLILGTQTAFTINSSFASASYIGCSTASDSNLTKLTVNDTGTGSIGLYNAYTPYQSSSHSFVGVILPALSTLNLNGSEPNGGAIGINVVGDQVTTGITVNGGTANGDTPDGGVVGIIFATAANGDIAGNTTLPTPGGAALGYNDRITLGNGTNLVQDNGLGNVHITLGSGANTVVVTTGSTITQGTAGQTTAASIVVTATPSSAESGHDYITFAAHTNATVDTVFVGYAQTAGTAPDGFAKITGMNANGSDTIVFAADTLAGTGVGNGNVNVINSVAGNSHIIANWFAAAESAASSNAHQVEAFAFGGNTYLVENSGAQTTIVELIGTTVTASSTVTNGVLALHGGAV